MAGTYLRLLQAEGSSGCIRVVGLIEEVHHLRVVLCLTCSTRASQARSFCSERAFHPTRKVWLVAEMLPTHAPHSPSGTIHVLYLRIYMHIIFSSQWWRRMRLWLRRHSFVFSLLALLILGSYGGISLVINNQQSTRTLSEEVQCISVISAERMLAVVRACND